MAITGMFLAFCFCCWAIFPGTDRHRHISRMIGVREIRTDIHIRAKTENGRPYHDGVFHGDGESRGASDLQASAGGFTFSQLLQPAGGDQRQRQGWARVSGVP